MSPAKKFDPLGFNSPFVMYAKILFQDLWKLGMAWDDKLPYNLEVKFKKWTKITQLLSSLVMHRCYFTNVQWKGIEYIELHGNGNASERAYFYITNL